jgi:8-oxo-dGTP pyrophosphatase MutT (NUDIX family)
MLIQAAGGVVQNEIGELLVIFRRGKWDLPKGKIDEDETPEKCALREVAEETGLRHVTLESLICQTYHVYEEFGKKILKETFWYKMKSEGVQNLVPQTEEDIEAVRWIQKKEWNSYSNSTYASINEVMDHFLNNHTGF